MPVTLDPWHRTAVLCPPANRDCRPVEDLSALSISRRDHRSLDPLYHVLIQRYQRSSFAEASTNLLRIHHQVPRIRIRRWSTEPTLHQFVTSELQSWRAQTKSRLQNRGR